MNTESREKAVLLITIDALRPDHLKSYNYHRNTAPNLEKLTHDIFITGVHECIEKFLVSVSTSGH